MRIKYAQKFLDFLINVHLFLWTVEWAIVTFGKRLGVRVGVNFDFEIFMVALVMVEWRVCVIGKNRRWWRQPMTTRVSGQSCNPHTTLSQSIRTSLKWNIPFSQCIKYLFIRKHLPWSWSSSSSSGSAHKSIKCRLLKRVPTRRSAVSAVSNWRNIGETPERSNATTAKIWNKKLRIANKTRCEKQKKKYVKFQCSHTDRMPMMSMQHTSNGDGAAVKEKKILNIK